MKACIVPDRLMREAGGGEPSQAASSGFESSASAGGLSSSHTFLCMKRIADRQIQREDGDDPHSVGPDTSGSDNVAPVNAQEREPRVIRGLPKRKGLKAAASTPPSNPFAMLASGSSPSISPARSGPNAGTGQGVSPSLSMPSMPATARAEPPKAPSLFASVELKPPSSSQSTSPLNPPSFGQSNSSSKPASSTSSSVSATASSHARVPVEYWTNVRGLNWSLVKELVNVLNRSDELANLQDVLVQFTQTYVKFHAELDEKWLPHTKQQGADTTTTSPAAPSSFPTQTPAQQPSMKTAPFSLPATTSSFSFSPPSHAAKPPQPSISTTSSFQNDKPKFAGLGSGTSSVVSTSSITAPTFSFKPAGSNVAGSSQASTPSSSFSFIPQSDPKIEQPAASQKNDTQSFTLGSAPSVFSSYESAPKSTATATETATSSASAPLPKSAPTASLPVSHPPAPLAPSLNTSTRTLPSGAFGSASSLISFASVDKPAPGMGPVDKSAGGSQVSLKSTQDSKADSSLTSHPSFGTSFSPSFKTKPSTSSGFGTQANSSFGDKDNSAVNTACRTGEGKDQVSGKGSTAFGSSFSFAPAAKPSASSPYPTSQPTNGAAVEVHQSNKENGDHDTGVDATISSTSAGASTFPPKPATSAFNSGFSFASVPKANGSAFTAMTKPAADVPIASAFSASSKSKANDASGSLPAFSFSATSQPEKNPSASTPSASILTTEKPSSEAESYRPTQSSLGHTNEQPAAGDAQAQTKDPSTSMQDRSARELQSKPQLPTLPSTGFSFAGKTTRSFLDGKTSAVQPISETKPPTFQVPVGGFSFGKPSTTEKKEQAQLDMKAASDPSNSDTAAKEKNGSELSSKTSEKSDNLPQTPSKPAVTTSKPITFGSASSSRSQASPSAPHRFSFGTSPSSADASTSPSFTKAAIGPSFANTTGVSTGGSFQFGTTPISFGQADNSKDIATHSSDTHDQTKSQTSADEGK